MSATNKCHAASFLPLESHKGRLHVERVGLVVRDIDRVATFYRDIMGLTVVGQAKDSIDLGVDGTTLLTLRSDPTARAEPADMPGLFHVAFLLPTRRDLADWLRHVVRLGTPLEGLSDHIVSEAIYLADPEGNGIEIYVDQPRSGWVWEGGRVRMATNRLDVPSLVAEASPLTAGPWKMPASARIGHVHLRVAALDDAARVLSTKLGLAETNRYPGAIFMAEGGYHHHVAVNTWNKGARQRREAGYSGLEHVTFALRGGAGSQIEGPSGIAFEIVAAD
ncbi:MAG: VOC family protein [Bosea sp. (in: a-proteobacteria)]